MKATGRTLTATPNHSKRTFTLRVTNADGTVTKYRTYPTNKEEFNQDLNNSENDWFYFLKSDNYFKIN